MKVPRAIHEARVRDLLVDNPAVALLGARQVGKTTLARSIASTWTEPVEFFDLESHRDRLALEEPELALGRHRGLVVLDEVQRAPGVFEALRVLIDRDPDRRFLVLGSASRELLGQTSETLAGRVAFHELTPFTLAELTAGQLDDPSQQLQERLWVRGGFPRSYLARSDAVSLQWRVDFLRTFVERDVPGFGSRVPPATFDRFLRMLAHSHGRIWNGSRIGSAFGVSHTTARSYLDLLRSGLVVRQLNPWLENVGTRQVRSPKVYIADPGLLHALLDLGDLRALERHPIIGSSWEGHVIAQLASTLGARPDQQFFWATQGGAELDYLVVRGSERLGFEIKRSTAPKVTRSLRSAIETLGLTGAFVVHAGSRSAPIAADVEAIAARDLATWQPPPAAG